MRATGWKRPLYLSRFPRERVAAHSGADEGATGTPATAVERRSFGRLR